MQAEETLLKAGYRGVFKGGTMVQTVANKAHVPTTWDRHQAFVLPSSRAGTAGHYWIAMVAKSDFKERTITMEVEARLRVDWCRTFTL